MSLLDHPDAPALLADATVVTEEIRCCRGWIIRFLQRYLPPFYRQEQRVHAAAVVHGLLSDLERKTSEPIARQAGVPRKNLQDFLGCGQWDDEAITAELRAHVREELADPRAVLVVDPSEPARPGPPRPAAPEGDEP